MLKAKYLSNGSFLQAERKNDSSFTWKSILTARSVLENGVAFLIRDDKTAQFWLNTWIGNEPLILRAMGNLTDPELSSTLHRYWNETEWDWNQLQNGLGLDRPGMALSFQNGIGQTPSGRSLSFTFLYT